MRVALVYVGHAFIDEVADARLSQESGQRIEDVEDLCRRGFGAGNDAAVGKSAVRYYGISLAVGREDGYRPPFSVKEQRIVVEATGMVFHVVAKEKERASCRAHCKVVPHGFVLRVIDFRCEQLVHGVL